MVITINPIPTADAGNDQTICSADSIRLNGSVTGASSSRWTTSGTGIFIPNDTTLTATYLPSAGDITAGTIILTLTTAGNGDCTAAYDALTITFTSEVSVFAGNDISVCANSNNIQLNGSQTGAGIFHWNTSGNGTFSPNDSTLNATYIPGAGDTSAGNVILILTATNACTSVSDSMTVTFLSGSAVNAGADQTICEGLNINLNGTIIGGTGEWGTTGDGSFIPNNTSLNIMYVPGPNGIAAGMV
jgi:hypothetical protein